MECGVNGPDSVVLVASRRRPASSHLSICFRLISDTRKRGPIYRIPVIRDEGMTRAAHLPGPYIMVNDMRTGQQEMSA